MTFETKGIVFLPSLMICALGLRSVQISSVRWCILLSDLDIVQCLLHCSMIKKGDEIQVSVGLNTVCCVSNKLIWS
uniref:Uncharacterized protein n=1 Tax=Arundo donax TaxID=35708 RepID=A0A0A9EZQ5_ARUDO